MYQYYPNQFGQPQYGMAPQQMPKAKYTQPLTPEIISKLRANGDSFDIKVSQEDLWRATCTHKENGTPTLVDEGIDPVTGNQKLRCTICGKQFEIVEATQEEVQNAVDLLINLLQTSKTMYLDAPVELIKQYYQILPLLEMFPKLYDRSMKNFAMYENAMGTTPGQVAVGTNGFQMMGAMLSNPYGYAYQQPQAQPWGYAPQAAPMAQPQTPVYGYQPAPAYGNPLMYTPQAAQAPQPAPMAPVPGVPAAPPAAEGTEVVQQKQFNV